MLHAQFPDDPFTDPWEKRDKWVFCLPALNLNDHSFCISSTHFVLCDGKKCILKGRWKLEPTTTKNSFMIKKCEDVNVKSRGMKNFIVSLVPAHRKSL